MISFAALNKEDSGSITSTPIGKHSKPTKEAQESAVLQLYHAAMKKQQEGKLEEAGLMYREILDSSVIYPINPSSGAMTNTLYRVKFLILKNLASIAKEKDDIPLAISAYLEASEYSKEDNTLFYQLALSSISIGDLVLARNALEQVLQISPRYWPAIDVLCKVLLALGDYHACLELAVTSLELNPQVAAAVGLIQHILVLCPEFLKTSPQLTKYLIKPRPPETDQFMAESKEMRVRYEALKGVSLLPESIAPPFKLNAISFESLGKFLIAVYRHCQETSRLYHRPSLGVPIDLYHVLDGVHEEPLPDPSKAPSQTFTTKDAADQGKRKRRLFPDCDFVYQPKRRSTRSRVVGLTGSVRKEHQDYHRMISQFIPPAYRLTTLPELSELVEVPEIKQKGLDSMPAIADVTEVTDEVHEVKMFIQNEKSNSGIISLVLKFLRVLAENYSSQWSTRGGSVVAKVFIDCFELVHKHITFPSPFSNLSESEHKNTRQLLLISLCYTELLIDTLSNNSHNITLPKKSSSSTTSSSTPLPTYLRQSMVFVQCLPLVVLNDHRERLVTAVRVQWIKCKWCLLKKQNESAVLSLDKCQEIIDDSHDAVQNPDEKPPIIGGLKSSLIVYLPNCSTDMIISSEYIEEKKRSLQQMVSLKNVHVMYREGKYTEVIEGLIPILRQELGSHSEFFLSFCDRAAPPPDDQPSVQLLLESLIHTSRIKECFECCVQTLIELLSYYTTHGASDQWTVALTSSCDVAQRCLESDSNVLSNSQFKVVQSFIILMIKTLDLIQDSFEIFPLSVLDSILPWKLLYKVLSCDNLPEVLNEGDKMRDLSDPSLVLMETEEVIPTQEIEGGANITNDAGVSVANKNGDQKPTEPTEEDVPIIKEGVSELVELEQKKENDCKTESTKMDLGLEAEDSTQQQQLLVAERINEGDGKQHTLENENVMDNSEQVPVASHHASHSGSANNDALATDSAGRDNLSTDAQAQHTVPSLPHSNTSPKASAPVSPSSSHKTTPPNQEASSISSPVTKTSDSSTPADTTSSASQSPLTTYLSQDVARSFSPLVTPPTRLVVSCPSSRVVTVSPSVTTRGSSVSSYIPEYKSQKEASLRFLQLAHSQLGGIFGCCNKDNGSFLHFIITTLHRELRELTALPKELREILLVELEQCYYCLYGYPYKKAKSRGLVDHGVDQVPLTWSGALKLLEYFHPSYLPSIDDTKSPQVTSELITLYKKIAEVVPKEGQIINKISLLDYVDGIRDTLPNPSQPSQHSSLIAEIYYLLADDALKSFDNNSAIRFYQCNLAYCPDRFDSWAGLALARVRRITDKIDQRELRVTVEKTVQKKTPPTLRCFQKTLELSNQHCYIVEKFGFFLYAVHSFASQVKKQPSLYRSKQVQDWASQCRKDMLVLADKQFSHALSLGGSKHSEPWIYHFMLGKIAMKLKKPPETILDHFIKSTDILHSEGAAYPVTVEVASKGHAVQALEVHYHFVSTILKLMLSPSSSLEPNPSFLAQSISNIRYYPLGCITYHSLWSWATDKVTTYKNPPQQGTHKDEPETMETEEPGNMPHPSQEEGISQSVTKSALPKGVSGHYCGSGLETHASEGKSPVVAESAVVENLLTVTQPSRLHSAVSAQDVTQQISNLDQLQSNVSLADDEKLPSSNVEKDDTPEPKVDAQILYPSPSTSTVAVVDYSTNTTKHTLPLISSEHGRTFDSPLAQTESITDNIDKEEELIIVDEGSGSSSPTSCHDTNAIELLAQHINANTSSEDSPEPMSRFSVPSPDPLTESLYGVAMCAVRFPAYFKPLYRLASALNSMGFPQEAKKFLLGPIPPCFTEIQEKLVPIFVMKSNIYQNMWQIQVNEINRPGNFSSHARSCLELLINVLTRLKDLSSLLFITQQLKSKVDLSRQYMRESERQATYIKSLMSCVDVLKGETFTDMYTSISRANKVLLEAYSIRNMVSKINESVKEQLIKDTEDAILTLFSIVRDSEEVQKWFLSEGIQDTSMDICLKYCQMRTKL